MLKLEDVDAKLSRRIKDDGVMSFHLTGCTGHYSIPTPRRAVAEAMAAQVKGVRARTARSASSSWAWARRGRGVNGGRFTAPVVTQSGNGIEEYPAMTNGTDTDFLQVLLCQVREDPLVDLVVAECLLVFFEAQAPQPDNHVHDDAHTWSLRSS
jgi:hypothetical protein